MEVRRIPMHYFAFSWHAKKAQVKTSEDHIKPLKSIQVVKYSDKDLSNKKKKNDYAALLRRLLGGKTCRRTLQVGVPESSNS